MGALPIGCQQQPTPTATEQATRQPTPIETEQATQQPAPTATEQPIDRETPSEEVCDATWPYKFPPVRLTDIPEAYNYRHIPRPPCASVCDQELFWRDNESITCYLVPKHEYTHDELVDWLSRNIPSHGWRLQDTNHNSANTRLDFQPNGVDPEVYEFLQVYVAVDPGDYHMPVCMWCGPPIEIRCYLPVHWYKVGYHLHTRVEKEWSIYEQPTPTATFQPTEPLPSPTATEEPGEWQPFEVNQYPYGGHDDIQTIISADRCYAEPGDPVRIRFTVVNHGDETEVLESEEKPILDIKVRYYRGSDEILWWWSEGREITPEMRRLELASGESKTIQMTWIPSKGYGPWIQLLGVFNDQYGEHRKYGVDVCVDCSEPF